GTIRGLGPDALAQATVSYAVESSERDYAVRVRADRAGAFKISLPLRAVTLRAEAPGCPPRSIPVAADATSIEVTLSAWQGIEGRVVDAATGRGVGDVPVYVVEGDGCVGLDVVPFTTRSD